MPAWLDDVLQEMSPNAIGIAYESGLLILAPAIATPCWKYMSFPTMWFPGFFGLCTVIIPMMGMCILTYYKVPKSLIMFDWSKTVLMRTIFCCLICFVSIWMRGYGTLDVFGAPAPAPEESNDFHALDTYLTFITFLASIRISIYVGVLIFVICVALSLLVVGLIGQYCYT